jgi:acetoin utilization deacetylase AcuC-like enzyme
MTILVYSHEASLLHDTGAGHPERPDRIDAVLRGARAVGVIEERSSPMASKEDLALVHDPAYVEAVADFCESGGGSLDPDTVAVPESWEAALRSAGAGVAAADSIESGEARVAFLAVRPPGHHALPVRAMGFCLFNNIAILAERLARAGARIAIVDWDVHHGNGTQASFYDRAEVLYVSLHEFPFYPGTGWLDEVGLGDGQGHTVNVPLPAGARGDAVGAAFERIVSPVLEEFEPDWLLVSSGYDAHRADPLAGLELESGDYGMMAQALASLGRPIVCFLEGGYDLAALEESTEATLRGFMGEATEWSSGSPARAEQMVDLAAAVAARHWRGVQDG